MEQDNVLTLENDEVIKFIKKKLHKENMIVGQDVIEKILDFEMEYLVQMGIAVENHSNYEEMK